MPSTMQMTIGSVRHDDVDIDDETVTHAGLALVAADTGRVLLLQRALEDDDPAGGKWEFPGGGRDEGETTLDAALREFAEETGIDLATADTEVTIERAWAAPSGIWHGFVGVVAAESEIDLHLDNGDRMLNPDDPDQDHLEAVAFFDPDDLPDMPALRDEMRHTPWDLLRFACFDPQLAQFLIANPSEFTVRGSTSMPIADRGRSWDGPAAASRIISWADGSAQKARRGFFWQEPDTDGSAAAHYKLPFADVVDGELTIVPRGVFAVAGRLNQTDIPESAKASIRRKVTGLYRRMANLFDDPDLESPFSTMEASMTVTMSTSTVTDSATGLRLEAGTTTTAPIADDALTEEDFAWESLMVVEGVPTGDGRFIERGGITGHRDLPLPLMVMFETGPGGHIGAKVGGRIDEIFAVDLPDRREWWSRGVFDADGEVGREAARMNKARMLRGVSVDLDFPEGFGAIVVDEEAMRTSISGARIGMMTMCPMAAFAEANIRLIGLDTDESLVAAGCAPCQAAREEAKAVLAAAAPGELAVHSDDDDEDDDEKMEACCESCAGGGNCAAQESLVASAGADITAQAYTPLARVGSLVASGVPANPPKAWFDLPELRPVRPVRILEDGRMNGYAALWGSCHTAYKDCQPVPRSGPDGYNKFHRGWTQTAEGEVVATGVVIMSCAHVGQNQSLGVQGVQDLYADTGNIVGRARLYEDEVGLWVSGATFEHVTDADVALFNSADGLSPHWEWERGRQDLAVLLAVPYSGFQVPNTLVASGVTDGTRTITPLPSGSLVASYQADGTPASLFGHNPGFDRVAVLEAAVARLSEQVDELTTEKARAELHARFEAALANLPEPAKVD